MRRTLLAPLTAALLLIPSATASGRATRICHGDTVQNPDASDLRYGKAKRFGPFTCKVRRSRGMRCTSKTGHGFELSRKRQKLW
jgi:hypothetical protein